MKIASVTKALPDLYYRQEEILAWLLRRAGGGERARMEAFGRSAQVEGRHLCLPLDAYAGIEGFGGFNDLWIENALLLGERAASAALAGAGLPRSKVRGFLFTTITGLATPSIDARLIQPLGLPPEVRRLPLFGLGCVAGAAGIARAADFLAGHPEGCALFLSVELCSLNFQRSNLSVPNLLSNVLFGDGAAAVVLAGEALETSGPRLLASRSRLYPESRDIMGWDITDRGFEIVLSAALPGFVRRHLPGDVDRFLDEQGLSREDIAAWICHPGGPRVLEAIQDCLSLPPGALEPSWRSLRRTGNLSSASILHVLADILEGPRPSPGKKALMLAMGPGFCSELLLLEF